MRKFSQMAAAAMGMAKGTSADRPNNPAVGDQFVNGTLGITEVYTENDGWQPLTSSSTGIPFGGTADRPDNDLGQPFFNGEEARLELFTSGTGWQNIVQETPGVVNVIGSYIEGDPSTTLTINGSNFASGAIASVVGQDGTETIADTTQLVSVAEITATFSGLSATNEPYDVKVLNPSNLYGVAFDILKVDDIPVFITQSGSLGTYIEESPMSVQISVTDEEESPLVFSVSSGSLPSGLSLDSDTGVISGTPVNVGTPSSTNNFEITVTDGNNTAQRNYSITITDRAPVWSTAQTLSPYSKDVSYQSTLIATDDSSIAGYTLFSGSLPPGLSLNSSSGVISGTPVPNPPTNFIFTIRATDAEGSYSDRQFTIPNTGPSFVSPSNLGFAYSDSNNIVIDATDDAGLTYSVISGSLPSGMSMSSIGTITGASTEASGTINTFEVRAEDTAGNAITRSFSLETAIKYFDFATHTFTSSMEPGYPYGPSFGDMRGAYSTTWDENSSYFSSPYTGIQRLLVPVTGTYRLEVAGARGGGYENNNTNGNIRGGGRGAIVITEVSLTGGDNLYIVPGKRGGPYSSSQCGGGGGGSFVSVGESYPSSTLLAAAGGGGGGGREGSVSAMDGQSSTTGGGQGAGSNGQGGTGGSGSEGGSSGGGWFSGGTGEQPGKQVRQAGSPSGAISVYGEGSNSGGFGGGAAGWGAPGGGGGYSGGGSLTTSSNRSAGGGGGSYYTGNLQSISTGSSGNYDNGYVQITRL